ncbi:MAG: hypothetical protein ACREIC_16485, partial [Limisphaerales bacterium]
YCALVGHATSGCVTNRVQWNVAVFEAEENPKVSGCAASGCEFHYFSSPCPVPPPEQITFLMTWVNVDLSAGVLERGGTRLLSRLHTVFSQATHKRTDPAIRDLIAFINEVDALARSGELSEPAAGTLNNGAMAAIMELGSLSEGDQALDTARQQVPAN